MITGNMQAQNRTIVVTGQVVEQDTRTPVEAATVQLLALPDSSQAAGHTTDKDGRFSLPRVKPGNYLLQIVRDQQVDTAKLIVK